VRERARRAPLARVERIAADSSENPKRAPIGGAANRPWLLARTNHFLREFILVEFKAASARRTGDWRSLARAPSTICQATYRGCDLARRFSWRASPLAKPFVSGGLNAYSLVTQGKKLGLGILQSLGSHFVMYGRV